MSMDLKKTNHKYDLFDPENPSRTIILSCYVDEDSAYDIIELIAFINDFDEQEEENRKDYERKPIKLIVNSFGGSVYDGFAIIAAIDLSKTPIHTYCYGSAMSMALLIFVAGHYRYAHNLSTFMYHECLDSPIQDKLSTLKENMDETQRIMDMYDKYLLSKTKLKNAQLTRRKKTKTDWYMSAESATEYGIVHEVL